MKIFLVSYDSRWTVCPLPVSRFHRAGNILFVNGQSYRPEQLYTSEQAAAAYIAKDYYTARHGQWMPA